LAKKNGVEKVDQLVKALNSGTTKRLDNIDSDKWL